MRVLVVVVALIAGACAASAHARSLSSPQLAASLAAPGTETDIDVERLQRLTKQRRVQMTLHQVLSITLIPTLGATAATGTANRIRIDQGTPLTPADFAVHRGLAVTSAALYVTTALMAITAPNPMRALIGTSRPLGKRDSSQVHKALAIAHASVFVALVVTGIVAANASLSPDAYSVLNRFHVVEGWAFFRLVTASGIVIASF